MSRTVTALFETRNEAEAARARLASEVKVETARLLAKDTAGALEGLSIDGKQVDVYRQALQRGDHLLVATVAPGQKPAQIIDALTEREFVAPDADEPKLSYEIGAIPDAARNSKEEPGEDIAAATAREEEPIVTSAAPAPAETDAPLPQPASAAPEPAAVAPEPVRARAPASPPPPFREPSVPQSRAEEPDQGVRVGEARQVPETSPSGERLHVESRAPARRLTDREIEDGGLLKERMIEVIEMREEPVITKEVVVREEVIIRKTVENRSETIRETVRSTNVDVEELP